MGWELECCCSAGGVEDLLVRFVRLSRAGNGRYWERKWLFSHTYVRALSTNVLHSSTYVQSITATDHGYSGKVPGRRYASLPVT